MRRLLRSVLTWYVLGYLMLVAGFGFILARAQADRRELRAEIKRAQAFDNLRAYEICLSNNQARADINSRFAHHDTFFASLGAANNPKLQRFLAEERSAALKPKRCVLPDEGKR